MTVLAIDHVAFVVTEVVSALPFWSDTLGLPLQSVRAIPEQEILLALLTVGESSIELIQPTTHTSGVARFLAKRGPGFHHICLEVDNIEAEIVRLETNGYELIDNQPDVGAAGHRVAFLHPSSTSGILIELSEHVVSSASRSLLDSEL
jgi:methylmalonyl-CoA/ethylmalonyl-CoA epimerase